MISEIVVYSSSILIDLIQLKKSKVGSKNKYHHQLKLSDN